MVVLLFVMAGAMLWGTPTAAAQNSTLQGLSVQSNPARSLPGTAITLRGNGYEACPDYGNRTVSVLWDGHGTGVSAPISSNGTFSTSFLIPAGTPVGDHWVYGQCQDGGDWARAVVKVTAPVSLAVTLSSTAGAPGSKVTVRGSGFDTCPDYGTRRADVLWDGYGTGVAVPIGANGTFTASLPVPADAAGGEHLVYGRCVDGGEWARAPFSVVPVVKSTTTAPPTSADRQQQAGVPPLTPPTSSGQPSTPPASSGQPPASSSSPSTPGPGAGGQQSAQEEKGKAEDKTEDPWQRPGFLDAIPTPGQVWGFLTSGGALALLIVPLLGWFLIGWPAELFNTTYRENESTIRRWLPFLPKERPARATSWPVVVAFAGVAALLMTAVQVNVTSLRQFAPVAFGYFIAIPLVVLAYEYAIEQRLRITPGGDAARLRVIGMALVIAVVCSAVSRLLSFQPGYVYGLLLGYTIVRTRDAWHVRVKAGAVLRGVVVLVALAACAWLFWQFGVRAAAEKPGASAALVTLDTLLSQIVVLSLETLAIGLVPVRFLHGAILFQWNRRVWLAVYATVLVLFTVVLIHWRRGTTWEAVIRSFWLFAAFCAGSLLFWAFFAVREAYKSRRVPWHRLPHHRGGTRRPREHDVHSQLNRKRATK
ncbi:FGLLP motif-containing membrane protein [Amycolatopsis sp. TNS106]|uniref:FGLLP motif-containing membrane protein n=1 Tax=Amycolatopsis sp. TNS106 TaxID=2861750 RepID=UPI001C577F43|nr:FGLLP motif-containing membrane protein [Amycolatopsis sp. TNS106]